MGVDGWTLYAHPLFLAELGRIEQAVETAKRRRPGDWQQHPAAVLLRAINHAVFEDVPGNPADRRFRLGHTLGKDNTAWFRVKLGGRFRLFFRYSGKARIIVFAWINDQETLRKAGSSKDVYAVFAAMLARGNPPTSIDKLVVESEPLARKSRSPRK